MRTLLLALLLIAPAAHAQLPPSKDVKEVPAASLVKQGYQFTNVFPGFWTFQKGNSLYICVPAGGSQTNTATLAAKTVATASCAEVN